MALSQEFYDRLEYILPNLHVGKVRNSYILPTLYKAKKVRLSVASDRISIYDFVLGFEIPQKGEVLTMMNFFWRKFMNEKFPQWVDDLLAGGSAIDQALPSELRGIKALWKRALVVEHLEMLLVEFIIRGYLNGNGWGDYVKNEGVVCGQKLPDDLKEGSKLQQPLFTPTTKAPLGEHDKPLDARGVEKEYGVIIPELAKQLFIAMQDRARQAGLILVDTKLEYGYGINKNGERVLTLGDEVGTPDSSRFWRESEYHKHFPLMLPPSLDKQFVREWGKKHGIDDVARFDTKTPEDQVRVKKIKPPQSLIDDTRDIYLEVPKLFTGLTLEQYQKDVMGIK